MKPPLSPYLDANASTVAANIRSRKWTAEAYAEALITQAKKWQKLNAFITFKPQQLLRDARRIDERLDKGEKLGPLAGLPIIVKDCIDTTEYATSSGTPSLKNYRPGRNAPALQRLLSSGAIVAGKANMHELAYGTTSNNYYTGPVHNPYNVDMISGGSSGGPAAAIAVGISPVGLGTDTGGSIRIPSSHCGIAGLRPTLMRWPIAGMMPAARTRDAIGPMGRRMADVCLLDAVVTGEPTAKAAHLQGLRLGVPRKPCWQDLDPEVEAVAEQVLEQLHKAGVDLIEVDLRKIIDLDNEHGFTIVFFESLIDMSGYLIAGNAGVSYQQMLDHIVSPPVKSVIPSKIMGTPDEYRTAMEGRALMQSLYAKLWQKHNIEALIFPTVVVPPRPIGHDDTIELNGKQVPTFPTHIRNTSPASVAGIPGLSLPAGLSKSGLPIGIELDGPAWNDNLLLSIGLAIEKLLPRLAPPIL
ncbi:MAG TPA: indoleacetamide hydrolase [Candidatus Saccharimonadales bacterium]|nr:indoleacetamide hydrolase [Candidatus Saccharimonadales bacterium]